MATETKSKLASELESRLTISAESKSATGAESRLATSAKSKSATGTKSKSATGTKSKSATGADSRLTISTESKPATGAFTGAKLPVVDIGVNFGSSKYTLDQIVKIIDQSKEGTSTTSGHHCSVECVISITNGFDEIPRNTELVETFKEMYCTIGVHPHNAHTVKNLDVLNTVITYEKSNNSKIVAIGECGLDYDRMFSEKQQQIDVFKRQVQIAKAHEMPLYLHCRSNLARPDEAFNDMVHILKSESYYKGVVHCFTGNCAQAAEFLEMGFYLGITGWIYDERRNKDLYDAIQQVIPIEKILVETDAPWLSINRKRKSIPIDTVLIAERIAQIQQKSTTHVIEQIRKNTHDLFKI
jgi:TatD DNase family protein